MHHLIFTYHFDALLHGGHRWMPCNEVASSDQRQSSRSWHDDDQLMSWHLSAACRELSAGLHDQDEFVKPQNLIQILHLLAPGMPPSHTHTVCVWLPASGLPGILDVQPFRHCVRNRIIIRLIMARYHIDVRSGPRIGSKSFSIIVMIRS